MSDPTARKFLRALFSVLKEALKTAAIFFAFTGAIYITGFWDKPEYEGDSLLSLGAESFLLLSGIGTVTRVLVDAATRGWKASESRGQRNDKPAPENGAAET